MQGKPIINGDHPQNPLTTLQTHLSNLLNPPTQTHHPFPLSLQTLGNRAKQALQANLSRFNKNPQWARVTRFDPSVSNQSIEERLEGVAVYGLSNSAEEFVLLTGKRSGKSLGLLCFRREDADALLEEMRSMEPGAVGTGSKVVAIALNKVVQMRVDGVALRFIPDLCQVKNAIKVKENLGQFVEDFSGVPVFQSKSLVLKNQNRRYRPIFFRKEDLDNSLQRASQQQKNLNPAMRMGDIQVDVLEEIIQGMKENSSNWDDVVFIPPGFNVPLNP
ncbi:hypothetical protein QJS04_geneDACA004462 [Acorus gramineus]|uniref:Protein TIC 22-like, chloroplastic n=1 Tax=Acorus gramineus TaxID=55184 RepID=A0AAV9B788_ACOGR|nr:hypothetical protein QJS04_geneDACA004462 [Acorus gramineus]